MKFFLYDLAHFRDRNQKAKVLCKFICHVNSQQRYVADRFFQSTSVDINLGCVYPKN